MAPPTPDSNGWPHGSVPKIHTFIYGCINIIKSTTKQALQLTQAAKKSIKLLVDLKVSETIIISLKYQQLDNTKLYHLSFQRDNSNF